jgi:hypothetical protein
VVGAQWRSALTITPEIGDVLLLKQEGKNGWSSRGVTCMQQKVEMCYGLTRKARVVGAQQTRGRDVLQSDQDCASGQRTAECHGSANRSHGKSDRTDKGRSVM